MGFLSSLPNSSPTKPTQGKTKTQSVKNEPYYPDVYDQDTRKSVVDSDNRYDLKRFSRHEADIILRVLRTTDAKYHPLLRSLGLINESFSITYKPRYVLFDIVILQYENSQNMVDRLAVALAYETKGAYYRKQAISYFEESIKHVDKTVLDLFHACPAVTVYTKFADVYEKEHDYKKAISYFKKARAIKGSSKEYLSERIVKLEKKLKSPPKVRKTKKPDYYDEFERGVRSASIAFLTGNFLGIELNARPNR